MEDASQEYTAPGSEEQSQCLRQVEALLEAGNTRVLDHVSWPEGCMFNFVAGGSITGPL